MKKQIRNPAGSSMNHNAEGFGSDSAPEFIRFLRSAKRFGTELQGELYVALVDYQTSLKKDMS